MERVADGAGGKREVGARAAGGRGGVPAADSGRSQGFAHTQDGHL